MSQLAKRVGEVLSRDEVQGLEVQSYGYLSSEVLGNVTLVFFSCSNKVPKTRWLETHLLTQC